MIVFFYPNLILYCIYIYIYYCKYWSHCVWSYILIHWMLILWNYVIHFFYFFLNVPTCFRKWCHWVLPLYIGPSTPTWDMDAWWRPKGWNVVVNKYHLGAAVCSVSFLFFISTVTIHLCSQTIPKKMTTLIVPKESSSASRLLHYSAHIRRHLCLCFRSSLCPSRPPCCHCSSCVSSYVHMLGRYWGTFSDMKHSERCR